MTPEPAPASGAAHLTFLLGGVRSGKSARAVALAAAAPATARVLFVATGQAFDDEMARRIDAHRRERPATWDTLESPLALADDLGQTLAAADAAGHPYAVVVVDCLTLWVSNVVLSLEALGREAFDEAEAAVAAQVGRLLAVRAGHQGGPAGRRPPHWIVVSNEVGLGIVPPTPLGRRYRDALGRANQAVAAAADEVTFMLAGLALPLKTGGGAIAPPPVFPFVR